MTFDLNAVPPNARSKAQIDAHREIYARTQDVCRVHNPTETDYVIHNDRRFANEKYLVPNINKDIGFGKGNNDVPRFIAKRYIENMGMEIINKKIKEDWDVKKLAFRLEERGQMEERLALRSNDPKLWNEITPKLFLGVVKRYQEEIMEEPEQKPQRKEYASPADEAMDRLGINDMEIGVSSSTPAEAQPDINQAQNNFINQIQ